MSTVSPVSRLFSREKRSNGTTKALSALYTPHSTPLHQPVANRARDMKCVFVLLLLVSVMAVTSAASDTAETESDCELTCTDNPLPVRQLKTCQHSTHHTLHHYTSLLQTELQT
ncbi:hypothetical protein ACOMHN_037778 [Nucella lapillus]